MPYLSAGCIRKVTLLSLRYWLECRLSKKGNTAITQVLVKWSSLPQEMATWEDYHVLRTRFSKESSRDQLILKGGAMSRLVMPVSWQVTRPRQVEAQYQKAQKNGPTSALVRDLSKGQGRKKISFVCNRIILDPFFHPSSVLPPPAVLWTLDDWVKSYSLPLMSHCWVIVLHTN
jgi:hypothetical protein